MRKNDESSKVNEFWNGAGKLPATPEPGIERARELLENGELYRYCSDDPMQNEVSLLEQEFAHFVGAKHALAVNSCGAALYLALLGAGVKSGDPVIVSAFTYTAVPSAVIKVGATPIFVECNRDLVVDIEDLRAKFNPNVRAVVISHMRGHVGDIGAVARFCEENEVPLIEDCAHSLGASFDGQHTGTFGSAGCFSTQSHKMINSGEGGLLVTNDDELMAKSILYSGSQEDFWNRHFLNSSRLPSLLSEQQLEVPNFSLRLSNLAAAVLRPQLAIVVERAKRQRERYDVLVSELRDSDAVGVPQVHPLAVRAPNTIQFWLNGAAASEVEMTIKLLSELGITAKWFGSAGNPRDYKNWHYVPGIEKVRLPQTDSITESTLDIFVPESATLGQVRALGGAIARIAAQVLS